MAKLHGFAALESDPPRVGESGRFCGVARHGHGMDLITLGSPLEFLSLREPTIQETVERCFGSPLVRKWTDYFDENDEYCSRVPVPAGDSGKFNAHRVNLQRTLGEKLGMKDLHDAYLKLPEVLDLVAGLAP